MKNIRKYLGLIWMLLGPAIIVVLLWSAIENIDPAAKNDIGRPVPWIIIIAIFTPIAIGLTLFGWYAWRGEYDAIKREHGEGQNHDMPD